ncbi:MAG: carboxypeptidase-like regulatory domain-containing protein, partial [Bryobacteraceae bacterium]|nr:carboxypeptidase-like regulatory domain-containing protein [Bryobacteraceae bacterium]
MRRTILILLTLGLSLALWAQIENGNITGRVTDPTGAVVVGAQVTVTQTAMNFETVTVTNEEGLYRALNLRPGPYRITITAPGFKKLVRDGIDLRIGQTLAVNLVLEVGTLTESIEVRAQAQLLESETSATGATLRGDYFYSLPNYQKHPQAVLFFTPGVTFASNAFTGSMSGLQVNGLGHGTLGVFEDGAIGTMGARGAGFINETIANSIEDIKVITTALPA